MHTTELDGWVFQHDGTAFEGPVRIKRADDYYDEEVLEIPGVLLFEFVAGQVASARISALENADWKDTLGIPRSQS